MPTLTRPVAYPPASALRLWIAELSYELSHARKMLKLAQQAEDAGQTGSILAPTQPTANATPSDTDAR